MCFFITPHCVKRRATKDIVFFKYCISILDISTEHFISFRDYRYEQGVAQPTERLKEHDYVFGVDCPANTFVQNYFLKHSIKHYDCKVVRKGYHGFLNSEGCTEHYPVGVFIIPKGSYYWVNKVTTEIITSCCYYKAPV